MNYEKILSELYDFKAPDKTSFIDYGIELLNRKNEFLDKLIVKLENVISGFYYVAPEHLLTTTRKKEIVETRFLIWYFAKKINKFYSLYYLGKLYNRDHSTVINGIKKVNNWIETDENFKKRVEEIEKLLDLEVK